MPVAPLSLLVVSAPLWPHSSTLGIMSVQEVAENAERGGSSLGCGCSDKGSSEPLPSLVEVWTGQWGPRSHMNKSGGKCQHMPAIGLLLISQ